MVDLLAQAGIARLVPVFLMQGRLHSPENMQARVLDEHVIDIQSLQDLIILLHIRGHSSSRRHVVGVVKASLVENAAVKVARVLHQVDVSWGLLVVIGDVWIVVLEVDREEDLPAAYGVHAAAVEKLGVDVGADTGHKEQRVHGVLLRNDIHDFDLGWRFGLDAYPGDFDSGILALIGVYLPFDITENVVLVDLLSFERVVDKQKGQDGIFARLKEMIGVHLEKLVDVVAVVNGHGQDNVNPGGFSDVRHGDDFDLAQGPHQVDPFGDRAAPAFLTDHLQLQVQRVFHPPGGVKAPVPIN